VLDRLYIADVIKTEERGWLAVIRSHSTDGVIMDVYGEDLYQAKLQATLVIKYLTYALICKEELIKNKICPDCFNTECMADGKNLWCGRCGASYISSYITGDAG